MDLIGVSLFMGLWSGFFAVGPTVLKVVISKMTKHKKTCMEIQPMFKHFVFNTFGFFDPYVVELFNRVQRIMILL